MANFGLGDTTLLLFALGKTGEDIADEKGMIPHHGPTPELLDVLSRPEGTGAGAGAGVSLKQHFCIAVESPDDVDEWESRLAKKGVKVLSTMRWPKGGRSVYFEDEDGHVGEFASRGIWPHW